MYFSDSSAIVKSPDSQPQPTLNVPQATEGSSSSISSVPSSPNVKTKPAVRPSRLKKTTNKDTAFGTKDIASRRALTPSPTLHVPKPRGSIRTHGRGSRTASPDLRGLNSKSVPHIDKLFDSTESDSLDEVKRSDRAFVVLDDRYQTRRHVRHNLYKEQKWMPSWNYSIE